MSARSKARKRALDVLYASEVRGRDEVEALDEARADAAEAGRVVNDYTETLVRGVAGNRARIDELISSYSQGWSLARMPQVDRNILRLAVFEVLYVDDVPDAVAVSEALHLARDLSTDDSPNFVNGVLGNIVRDKDTLVTPDWLVGKFTRRSGLAGPARGKSSGGRTGRLIRRRFRNASGGCHGRATSDGRGVGDGSPHLAR